MNVESDDSLLLKAVNASIEAGKAIMEVYASDFSVEYKGDSSPLTKADRYSHKIIKGCLSRDSRKIPILSEEGRAGDNRSGRGQCGELQDREKIAVQQKESDKPVV
ncbi:MAG: inositol monophosphatase family protein [Syntrophales bacterium]|nr:inositol monophosphatase family protein [Syntrophales bacterium]